MERHELEGLSREGLIAFAERVGISRPRVLTQPELVDEIIAKSQKSEREKTKARGWVGRARDLVARLIEKGLHMPEARALGGLPTRRMPEPPPPLATVTLAEIYAAQGHLDRALAVLDEVLAKEPEHRDAQRLRDRFADQAARARAKAMKGASLNSEPPKAADVIAPLNGSAASMALDPAAMPASAPALPKPLQETAGSEVASRAPVVDASADADAPLPARYAVDEVVAIAVDPRTIYLYWEIRPATLARARARQPEGRLAIRVISVLASWDGPITRRREVNVDALHGDLYVHDIEPGAHVRVAIGWLTASFEPFAVGMEVVAPKALPIETAGVPAVARWRAEADAEPGADVQEAAVTPAWRAIFRQGSADDRAAAPSPGALRDAALADAAAFMTEEPIVEQHRYRRPVRGGASELAWEDVEVSRRQGVPRGGGGGRGGASDLSRR